MQVSTSWVLVGARQPTSTWVLRTAPTSTWVLRTAPMSVLAAPPDERRLGRTAPDLNACTGPQCMMPQARHLSQVLHGEHTDEGVPRLV